MYNRMKTAAAEIRKLAIQPWRRQDMGISAEVCPFVMSWRFYMKILNIEPKSSKDRDWVVLIKGILDRLCTLLWRIKDILIKRSY